jgi:hypothetical protein
MSDFRKLSRWYTLLLVFVAALIAGAATIPGSLTFTDTPLLRPEGDSEPAISIGPTNTMAITGLTWLASVFGTNLWTGPTGSTQLTEDPWTQHCSSRTDCSWRRRCRCRLRFDRDTARTQPDLLGK